LHKVKNNDPIGTVRKEYSNRKTNSFKENDEFLILKFPFIMNTLKQQKNKSIFFFERVLDVFDIEHIKTENETHAIYTIPKNQEKI
jgi:hypothetical protein